MLLSRQRVCQCVLGYKKKLFSILSDSISKFLQRKTHHSQIKGIGGSTFHLSIYPKSICILALPFYSLRYTQFSSSIWEKLWQCALCQNTGCIGFVLINPPFVSLFICKFAFFLYTSLSFKKRGKTFLECPIFKYSDKC